MERRHSAAIVAAAVFAAAVLILAAAAPPNSASAANLRILVPLKMGFNEFVNWSSPDRPVAPDSAVEFSGFSVEVFRECIKHLDHPIDYTLVPFGDGINDPSYGKIVEKLVSGEADGVVGDLTITSDRLKIVDFTLPYLQSSLKMVAPVESKRELKPLEILHSPFSWDLWLAIAIAFVATVVSIAIVEPFEEDNEAELRRRLGKSFWFTCLGTFFIHREDMKSAMGRGLVLAWFLVVLIFTSSYTASLSSIILARQRRIPTIRSFSELQKGHGPIGCQEGSFTVNYFENNLDISRDRLLNLVSVDDYKNTLNNGSVAAIVDESPYIDVFLSKSSHCKDLKMVDSNIAYFGGLAFAFQKNDSFQKNYSSLRDNISFSIVSLEQSGELQALKNKWLGSGQCPISLASDNVMSFSSFKDLFAYAMPATYGALILMRIASNLCKSVLRRERLNGQWIQLAPLR